MKIAIAGGTGFLGGALSKALNERTDCQVVNISRTMFSEGSKGSMKSVVEGSDVVINLVGGPMFRRWNRSTREQLYDSRVKTTEQLVQVINSLDRPPKLFISASAIGYYPSELIFSEHNSRSGNDYLSWLCSRWEEAAGEIVPQTRLVIVRIAPVLARTGGVMNHMIKIMDWHLSLRFGDGRNFFSWIHIRDFVAAMLFLIDNDTVRGVVNISSPGITTNGYMNTILSNVMNISHPIKVPAFIIRLVLGESVAILLGSKAIYPAVLIEHGFHFQYPYIRAALENIAEK